jgi:iron complex outermembrane receptor protein
MTDRVLSLLGLLLAGTASLAAPAAADDADTIVVTAQRQAYRGDFTLRETPQAITQIGQQQIDNNNITRLTDALDLSASVARQNNFGGLWDAYAVRGFAGDENLPSGYLVNGFNGGRGFGGSRDIAAIERIEVLKGPNAALFGRGEPGGTINIVTKRADFDTRGRVNLLAGSFDRQRGDADINLAVSAFNAGELQGWGYAHPQVLPLLLDFSALDVAPDRGVIRRFSDGKVNILFVGRCAPNKKIEDVMPPKAYDELETPRPKTLDEAKKIAGK